MAEKQTPNTHTRSKGSTGSMRMLNIIYHLSLIKHNNYHLIMLHTHTTVVDKQNEIIYLIF